MHTRTSWAGAILALLAAAPASAQGDLIYYPFVEGTGTSVANLAAGGPKTGTLTNTNTTNSGWVAGKGGSYALSGRATTSTGAYVDTGLSSTGSLFTGSFTIAFFMKSRIASGTAANYLLGGVGSFRLFTGGVAYQGLYLRNWGGTPADLILPGTTNKPASGPFIDLVAASQKDWVHVALVADDTAKVANWYINGSLFSTTALTAGANVTGTGTLKVGMQTSVTTGSDYDIDDFRLHNRAATPHEVQAWAMAMLQADKTGISVSGQGKQALSLDAGTANQSRLYWVFGSLTGTWPVTTLGGVSIPLVVDPYTELAIQFTNTPVFATFRGVLDASGKAAASFNVPAGAPGSVVGLRLFHSFLVYDAGGNYYGASNAVPLDLIQ